MSNVLPSHQLALVVASRTAVGSGRRSIVAGAGKRLFDIALAGTALLLLWPLMVAIALAIRMADGGPALFAQRRVGRHGRPFTCLKFRTMVLNAEEALLAHLEADPQARREWDANQKLEDDPRVTGLGAFLRKSSLDELPQLFNILAGQMSVVGPRPIVPAEIDRYGDNFAACFSVRPGLTGLWQVSGRSDCNYQTRVTLDYRYAVTWSLLRDAEIVIRTIPAVLSQRGSR